MKYLKSNRQMPKDINLDLETGESTRRDTLPGALSEKKKQKMVNPDKLQPLINQSTKTTIVDSHTTQTVPHKRYDRKNTEESFAAHSNLSTKRTNQHSQRLEQFSEYQSVLQEGSLINTLAFEQDEKGIKKVFKEITGLRRNYPKSRPRSQQAEVPEDNDDSDYKGSLSSIRKMNVQPGVVVREF